MNLPPPRLILPSTTKRDAFIGIVAGALLLIFVGYGIFHMARPVAGNKLTGMVVGKTFTPLKERQIDFNGRKVGQTRELDGEYLLKVRVATDDRVYEVPVEKLTYESKKEGDSMTFLRPESEQR